MNPDQLREAIAYLDACLLDLHQDANGELRSLDADQQTAFDEGLALRNKYHGDLVRHETIGNLAQAPEKTERVSNGFNTTTTRNPQEVAEDRSSTSGELRDAALRSVEARAKDAEIDDDKLAHAAKLIRRHSTDEKWVRGVILRSSETYERAFAKLVTNNGQALGLTPDEQRVISVGVDTAGGFLVPTVIDPTLIYTNSGTDNIIRRISRVVTLTGDANAVNVISSAGVTASWDPELTEVSDDSPAVARPNIPIFKAAAFIAASIEAEQDMGGFFSGISGLFADAKDRLEGAAFATGSGSNQPTGIFTALDANTNVELTSTTAATVGEVDLHAVYRALGYRWRSRASWLMNPLYSLAIKRLGTGQNSAYTGNLTEPPTERILGRPAYEAEDAPTTQTTTALDNVLVFGDFSNYVIADKPASMRVEYIPHLFGTTNNRPIGARGWYAYWRTGADSVNDLAFRLLQDKTSA